ncbi:hypothetical protein ACFL1Q_00435 [Patescibacteria group bacterium]
MIISNMLETPHVAVGVAIATKIGNPFLAIPLSLASHFVLERVPHWNPHLNTETEKYGKPTKKSTIIAAVDSTLALAGGSFIALSALPNTTQMITIFACCFASVLPDVLEAPYFFLNIRPPILKRWIKFQKSIQVDASFLPGILTQIAVITASLYWIFT